MPITIVIMQYRPPYISQTVEDIPGTIVKKRWIMGDEWPKKAMCAKVRGPKKDILCV